MKFSLAISTGSEGLIYPVPFAGPEDFMRQGRLAERLGYDGVWGNDHITTQNYVREMFPGRPPSYYEPLMVLAAIGAVTTKLKLGTALTVLPMREPVYLAKQVTTLDQMCGGRFILAVGLGAYREEFVAWGGSRVSDARRGDMMDEGLEALRLLFTESRCSLEGKYYSFTDIEMFPKSVTQPFPLYVGGHNIAAVERAARYGRGWLPGWRPMKELEERIRALKDGAAALGRDPATIEIAPQLSVTIDRTQEAAERRYMESGLVAHRKSLAYTGRDMSQQVDANLVGSPDVLLEKVERFRSIGVDHCCALIFPADSVAEMEEQVEWFASDVMAKLR